ncbi:MAG TPA: hypothetical protein VFH27_08310 [Longimicrobiaceae bacterium]|nr:hypothetical protein [Longimicrobiaceae bacterium]
MAFRAPSHALRRAVSTVLVLLGSWLAGTAAAQREPVKQPHPAPAAAPAGPERVVMGMYVVDVPSFELKSSTYSADFYLWVRWNGARDATGYEIMNGSGEACVLGLARAQGAEHYAVYRCHYQFHGNFDLRDYPLDKHELTVQVEDKALTQGELVYVPDVANTSLDSGISIPGWDVGRPRMWVRTHNYTALGDPTYPHGTRTPYSRLVLAIPISRSGSATYLKSFLVMFLSVGVGLLASALHSEHVEARLGIGVASIFGVVSSYLVVSQALPETSQFTLADQLHLVGMGSVFLSIMVSVAAYRLLKRLGEARAERLDRVLGLATTALYVVATVAVTVLR